MDDDDTVRIGREGNWLQIGAGERGKRELWSVDVELHSQGVVARKAVWLGEPAPRLDEFFAEMAGSWRGWDGGKTWASTEGDLSLRCTHDGVGAVVMAVELSDFSLEWEARARVAVDPGQLERVARDLARLLATR